MNFSENRYIDRNACTFVKYNIEPEYDRMSRDYLLISKTDIYKDDGKFGMFTKDYSYGILTHIYNTNVFILDIDGIKHQAYYNYNSEDKVLADFAKKYNDIRGRGNAQRKLDLIITQYKKIFGHRLRHIDVYKTNQDSGIHIYFELDNYYDLSGVYKYDLSRLIACNGYLKFVIYSGYSNIRITNKVLTNKPMHLSRITRLNENRVYG